MTFKVDELLIKLEPFLKSRTKFRRTAKAFFVRIYFSTKDYKIKKTFLNIEMARTSKNTFLTNFKVPFDQVIDF